MLFLGAGGSLAAQQLSESEEIAALPDAPQAQTAPNPSEAVKGGSIPSPANQNCPPAKPPAAEEARAAGAAEQEKNTTSACKPKFDFLYPLGKPPGHGHRLTSTDKLRLAASDVVDPFNLLTIGATAAISVGSDPNTGYGPGMKGWVKNSATLLTEDMTGSFFSTYFIPSITKQDPRYYRMPNASIPRRIVNVIVQPVWARSDNGGHMPNYGMLIGVPASVALADLYVPGRKQGVWSVVSTSAISIASAPIDNIVNEFLPDVAKRFNVHIVLIQRIVNQLTLTEGTS